MRDSGSQWEVRLMGILAAVLVAFGIIAVYGASSILSAREGGSGSEFALRQAVGAILGLILLLVAARIDYHVWQRFAWPILLVAAVLLSIPLLPMTRTLAPEVNGARRWIDLGFFTMQPSEIAKFGAVAWAAMLATKKGERLRDFKLGVLPFVVILGPVALMILLEPDLSTAALLALIVATVLFVAGARIGHFMALGLLAAPILWREVAQVHYRFQRMVSFLSPGGDTLEQSWQINQSLIGIGSGQLFGVGFGEGLQKLGYLPLAYSDFIFSTIGEEWGFVGITVLLFLFVLYMGLGFRIARTAPDQFGMLLAVGLTAMVGITALLHIAVSLAVVPTTGLPLPFVSFGRSNLLVSLFATGVILNIGASRE